MYIRVYDISTRSRVANSTKTKYDSLNHQVSIDAPLVYDEIVQLKEFDDPYEHNTIYKINPLPYGRYQILVSNNPEFNDDGIYKETISSNFYVSDLFISAYEKENDDDNISYTMLLIDRKSGKPFAKKPIELFEINNADSKLQKIKQYQTNTAGEFTFNINSSKYKIKDILLFVPEQKQWITLDEIFNIPKLLKEKQVDTPERNEEKSLIMTDRAIYRPGQPVHFKAILYSNHFQNGRIAANEELTIRLKDANNQEIKSLTLTTNTFGSIHSSFQLPTQTLNGNFRLELFHNNKSIKTKYIKVEEYKRPTFKVTFEANKSTYTKADTAVFIGKVGSLTGIPVPNSTVNYTVDIKADSPYFNNKTDSTTISDSLGNFIIAIPLMDSIYSEHKQFTIRINAEAKNPSEEIQTAYTSYSYHDQPKVLSLSTNYNQQEFKWKTIDVETTNSNGFPLPSAGIINIYKYESINLPLGENTLDFKEGYNLLDTLDYQRYFPNYYDKVLHHLERKKTLVASYPFDNAVSSKVTIDSTLFDYGEYLVEGLSFINEKDTLPVDQQVNIYNAKNGKYTDNTFLSYAFDKNKYTENDTARLTFYSDLKEVQNVFLWKINGTEITPTVILPFIDGKAEYQFVVDKQAEFPKTNFEALLVKDNKIKRLAIDIPYNQQTKKNINIITKTFRDKITPGQKEKWSFTILQNDTKAEVLATMYDSSLDQFSSNSFSDDFYLSYPYFRRHSLNHISREFYTSVDWQYFSIHNYKLFKVFTLPQFKNYKLWSYANFSNPNLKIKRDKDEIRLIEEVLLTDYGIPMRMGMTTDTPYEDIEYELEEVEMLYDELKDPNLHREVENLKLKQNQEKEDLLNTIQLRTNLQETAFFYPELYTDEEGNITFEFDTPEALTKWKLLLFAHTKDLQSGNATLYTQTQKQLMVQPNLPRFMRVGDQIIIKSLVSNLTENNVNGSARLQFIDPKTNQVIPNIVDSGIETKEFTIVAKNNSTISWSINVPEGYPTVWVKIVAANEEFTDGEQQELAIIPNDILIPETQKIVLEPDQQKEFYIKSADKNNLQAQVIVQANPILEILSSLEYLKNYPYECAEQVASKWFGIKTIQYIQKHYPTISTYFNTLDTANISSSLREKASTNELSLAEMPWLRSIVNEEEKLKQLASLFNNNNIKGDLKQLEARLNKLQKNDGSFVWFDGGNTNLAISIRLLEIFGKVYRLDSTFLSSDNQKMILKLKSYLNQDNSFVESTSYNQIIDYAYAHQYWLDDTTANKKQNAWVQKALRNAPLASAKQSAGIASKSWIVAHRYGLKAEANAIFNRLGQEYIIDSLMGIYWKSNDEYYNAVSLQTYLIEAYNAMKPQFLKGMSDWIFYQKTHNNWQTTWMSVDAVYALLLANNPADFTVDNKVSVSINGTNKELIQTGIGQVSQNFDKEDLRLDNIIKVENNNNRKIYGSIVHQYFLPLEEVKSSSKDIAVIKHILVFRDNEWIASNSIKSGEKVKIRLEVISNKNLNFVHLKDNRAAGFEPEYRPSGYQFRNTGYYFTNKDASTNYFIDFLPKGKHIFEYEVKTNNIGLFNTGISQVECMYDPSVNARSENLKIEIKE